MKTEVANKLITLKDKYKIKLERELRENQMHGVTYIISTVMDKLFNEVGETLK